MNYNINLKQILKQIFAMNQLENSCLSFMFHNLFHNLFQNMFQIMFQNMFQNMFQIYVMSHVLNSVSNSVKLSCYKICSLTDRFYNINQNSLVCQLLCFIWSGTQQAKLILKNSKKISFSQMKYLPMIGVPLITIFFNLMERL